MISFVRGIAVFKTESVAVLDIGGIGYKVNITYRDSAKIGNDEVLLHTYFAVREDSMELYGFLDKEDLDMFNLLISVSGVGPKAALSILSAFNHSELAGAILLSDVNKIKSAHGIGAKTAQRIILELKSQISDMDVTVEETEVAPTFNKEVEKEAVAALMSLGYSQSESAKAVRGSVKETVEETVKAALMSLMRG